MAVHFSSATDQWATPQDLFDRLDAEHHFETDVCADAGNAKCENFYSVQRDGLSQGWYGPCWMNPPYGQTIGLWVAKAARAAAAGATVVCLLPARTDTRWFHDYIWDAECQSPRHGVTVDLLRGRLKFGDAKNCAPFPSMVVTFRIL